MAPPFSISRPISGHDLLHPTDEQLAALTRGFAEHRFYVLNHAQIRLHFSERMVQEMLAEPNPVRGIEGLLRAAMDERRRDLRDACARVIEGYGPLKEEVRRDRASATPRRLDKATEDRLRSELWPVIEEHYRDAKCMRGTREGILSTLVEETASALEGPNKIVWIHGVAGAGKTSIMGSLAPQLRNDTRFSAVSLFSCARDVEARRSVLRILPNIAWDLAYSIEGFDQYLAAHLASGNRVQSLQIQLEGLVLEPWRQSGSPAAVVLIDALDECEDMRETRVLLDAISSSVHARERIAFVLASRHVPPVSDYLDQSPLHFVCNISSPEHRQSVDSDIKLYIRASYSQTLHAHICRSANELVAFGEHYDFAIERIRDQSSGIFMCAFVICSALQSDSTRVDFLLSIMQQRAAFGATDDDILYRTYRTALSAAFRHRYRCPSALEKRVELARRVLGIILCAADPLDVAAIARFAGPGQSKCRVVEVLRLCRPLLSWHEQDAPVTFMHASVADFLLSEESGAEANAAGLDFHLISSASHHSVAQRCLDILREDLHFNMYDLRNPEEKPTKTLSNSLLYASTNWVDHLLHPCGPDMKGSWSHIVHLLQTSFLFWLEILAARSEVALRGIPMMQRLLHSAGPEPDAFLIDCSHFVRHLHQCMASGPASVYLLAVPFAPTASRVLQQLDTDVGWLRETRPAIIMGQRANWGAEHVRWTLNDLVYSMAVPSADDQLLVGFCNGSVALIACDTGVEIWRSRFERLSNIVVTCTKVSSGLARFAAASTEFNRIYVGNLDSGEIVAECICPQRHQYFFNPGSLSVCYSPDGAWLSAFWLGGKAAIWDLAHLQPHDTVSTQEKDIQQFLACHEWRCYGSTGLFPLGTFHVPRFAVSNNGRRLAIVTFPNNMLSIGASSGVTHASSIQCNCFDLDAIEPPVARCILPTSLKSCGIDIRVLDVAFSGDGKRVLVALADMRVLSAEIGTKIWSTHDVDPNAAPWTVQAGSFTSDAASVCFVLDGDQGVVVRDLATGYQHILQTMHRQHTTSSSTSSSNSRHFVVNNNHDAATLIVWNRPILRRSSSELLAPLPVALPDSEAINSDFSADHLQLVHVTNRTDSHRLPIVKNRCTHRSSGVKTRVIELWDVQQALIVWTTAIGLSGIPRLVFSPTGSYLTATSRCGVLILDNSSGDIIWNSWQSGVRTTSEFHNIYSTTVCVRFSRNDRNVAWWNSTSRWPEVHLLDLSSAHCQVNTWRLHVGRIRELAFSTDGHMFATWEDTISAPPLIWSADTGQLLVADHLDNNEEFHGLYGRDIHVVVRFAGDVMQAKNAACPRGGKQNPFEDLDRRASRAKHPSLLARSWFTWSLARISALDQWSEVSTETNTICFYRTPGEVCVIRLPSPDPWKAMNNAYTAQSQDGQTGKSRHPVEGQGTSLSQDPRSFPTSRRRVN